MPAPIECRAVQDTRMTGSVSPEPTVIEPLDLEAAAAALCCRFGEASAEAYRLSTLHDVLSSSRALARALDSFTAVAAEHYRGIHCTADMRADAQRVAHALALWSDSVLSAGTAYREWTTDGAITGLTAERPDVSGAAAQFSPIMRDHSAPTASPA
jgi:hypothetical protein